MGWGVQVKTEIYISRVLKEDVDSKIEENEKIISSLEKEISMLISSNPRDIVSEDARIEGSIIEELKIKFDEILELYKGCLRENVFLGIVKEDIDKAENC